MILPDVDVGCDLSPVRGLATPCRMSAGSSDCHLADKNLNFGNSSYCHLADKKRTLETLPPIAI
jgi:hypothetical protein